MKFYILVVLLPCILAFNDTHIQCPDETACDIGKSCCPSSDVYTCCNIAESERQNKKLVLGNRSYLLKNIMDVDGDPSNLQENTTDVNEDSSNLQENITDVNEDSSNLQENITDVNEDSSNLQENTTDVNEDPSNLQKNTTDVNEDPSNLQKNTTDVNEDSSKNITVVDDGTNCLANETSCPQGCCPVEDGSCCLNSTSCCPKSYNCCGNATKGVWCCHTKQRCFENYGYCIAGANSISSVFLSVIMMIIIASSFKHIL